MGNSKSKNRPNPDLIVLTKKSDGSQQDFSKNQLSSLCEDDPHTFLNTLDMYETDVLINLRLQARDKIDGWDNYGVFFLIDDCDKKGLIYYRNAKRLDLSSPYLINHAISQRN